jgi:hypothetical protein
MHNDTPFSAGRGGYRDRQGREVWVGVLRASFDIEADGRVVRAERQTAPVPAATWVGEPGLSSLLDDCDFQPKGGTDVLVRGHAEAPRGRPVSSLEVGLRVGQLHKSLLVHGARVWVRSATSSEVVPGPSQSFARQALDYERAFGGLDARSPAQLPPGCAANPVGSGFAHDPLALLETPAPQIEHPGQPLVAGPHQLLPAGFGPIAPHWQPRVGLAGTYDAAWQEHRAPLPPDDYREGFRRCAPQDQQLPGYLRGGEVIELTHMTAEGLLRVRIPAIRVQMKTLFSDATEESEAHLQTVTLLPSERRLELTYMATTPCQGRDHKLLSARLGCSGERTWQ